MAVRTGVMAAAVAKVRVGFTCSTFDLLHAGHILMLEEARAQCDHLIVGLQTDPSIDRPEKNKPVQTLIEREIQLRAVRWVDDVRIYQTEHELLELLEVLRPDVRVIGEDYRYDSFTGKSWCEQNDIEIYYNSRKHNFSTTDLRKRVRDSE